MGLTTSGEYLDALELLPDGRLAHVHRRQLLGAPGSSGAGEDLLIFTPTALGPVTSGSHKMYFDGSDVALTSSTEKLDAAAVTAGGRLGLSTTGAFSVPGVAGAAGGRVHLRALVHGADHSLQLVAGARVRRQRLGPGRR